MAASDYAKVFRFFYSQCS